MANHENLKIIAFVGMTGSGKSVVVDYLTEKGHPKVYFGGVIYEAMAKAGIEKSEENEKEFRSKIRQEHGQDFVVKEIIQQIHSLKDAGQHRIVADGLYSWTEYKTMKHEFPGELTVVAVVAPRHVRYHRLLTRDDRPQTEEESNSRDWSEIENIEKGGPIAMADYYLLNDGDLNNIYQQIDSIVSEIEF